VTVCAFQVFEYGGDTTFATAISVCSLFETSLLLQAVALGTLAGTSSSISLVHCCVRHHLDPA
jgi:hypothetical protein